MVSKPTSTSSEQEQINEDSFPEVLVCKEYAFNSSEAKKHGYSVSAYPFGRFYREDPFCGWSGANENSNNSSIILDEILTVKVNEPLDLVQAFKLRSGNWRDLFNHVSYSTPVYPKGRCMLLNLPAKVKQEEMEMFWLHPKLYNKTKSPLNIILIDSINSAQIYPETSEMKGDRIRLNLEQNNKFYYIYKIKISRYYHFQGDPLFKCYEYSRNNTYRGCVQKEIAEKFKNILGCVPPMLAATDMQNICNRRFNLTGPEDDLLNNLFTQIYESGYKPDKCKPPCTRTEFHTERMSKTPSSICSMLLTFDQTVSVTRSSFSINAQTFLTR